MKKFSLFLLLMPIMVFLSSCQTTDSDRIGDTINKKKSSTFSRVPVRPVSNDMPLKVVHSNLNTYEARECVKGKMLGLGIPPDFILEAPLTDSSKIIVLHNPYTNSEGMYVRIKENSKNKSVIELYDNQIKYISKSWYTLLNKCA